MLHRVLLPAFAEVRRKQRFAGPADRGTNSEPVFQQLPPSFALFTLSAKMRPAASRSPSTRQKAREKARNRRKKEMVGEADEKKHQNNGREERLRAIWHHD